MFNFLYSLSVSTSKVSSPATTEAANTAPEASQESRTSSPASADAVAAADTSCHRRNSSSSRSPAETEANRTNSNDQHHSVTSEAEAPTTCGDVEIKNASLHDGDKAASGDKKDPSPPPSSALAVGQQEGVKEAVDDVDVEDGFVDIKSFEVASHDVAAVPRPHEPAVELPKGEEGERSAGEEGAKKSEHATEGPHDGETCPDDASTAGRRQHAAVPKSDDDATQHVTTAGGETIKSACAEDEEEEKEVGEKAGEWCEVTMSMFKPSDGQGGEKDLEAAEGEREGSGGLSQKGESVILSNEEGEADKENKGEKKENDPSHCFDHGSSSSACTDCDDEGGHSDKGDECHQNPTVPLFREAKDAPLMPEEESSLTRGVDGAVSSFPSSAYASATSFILPSSSTSNHVFNSATTDRRAEMQRAIEDEERRALVERTKAIREQEGYAFARWLVETEAEAAERRANEEARAVAEALDRAEEAKRAAMEEASRAAVLLLLQQENGLGAAFLQPQPAPTTTTEVTTPSPTAALAILLPQPNDRTPQRACDCLGASSGFHRASCPLKPT